MAMKSVVSNVEDEVGRQVLVVLVKRARGDTKVIARNTYWFWLKMALVL